MPLDFLVPIAGIAAGMVLGLPVVRAVVRAIDRKTAGASGVAPEDLATLRADLEQLRGMVDRVSELEERLDFAERLLVQRQEAARLPEDR